MITVELPPFKLPLRVVKSSSSKAILRSNFITGKNSCSIASHVIRKREKFVVGTVTQDKRDGIVVEIPKEKDEEDRSVSSDPSEELMTPLSSSPLAILGEGFGNKLMTRGINAAIVLAAGAFATTKLLTVDHDYWQGWTVYEILRYAPEHNWIAYEETLKTNPVFAKMVISGVVYTLGDWIAQCCEGKPLFEFDRNRLLRSGLVGFTFHGSLSHYYYQFCEALFPFQSWWVVPAKIALDQTLWTAIWNSIYYSLLGLLRSESPTVVFQELKETFWPMLTAGWKLWPFAHVITYGVVPVEQRLLWVDSVELIWVTILSTYSNAKSEARISEASADSDSSST